MRSERNENLIYPILENIEWGNKAEDGAQLRPHIVWFEEPVPMIEEAIPIVRSADIFAVVGTSLVVYPAAGLIEFVGWDKPKFLIDPKIPEMQNKNGVTFIQKKATEGVPELVKQLLS